MEQFLKQLETATHASLRRTFEYIDIGPFCAYFDPLTDLIWLNYAAPVRSILNERIARKAIGDLRAEFKRRQRRLRFEFMQSLWLALPRILLKEGLILQAEQPLMICTPHTFQPRSVEQLRIQSLRPSDDDAVLDIFVRTAAEGFADMDEPIPVTELRQRLRVDLQARQRFGVIGWMGDVPAGVAALSPMGETAELVGVTTLPHFRRRGIATALSSFLIAAHFARGGSVAWLSAGNSVAQSAYGTLGFSDAGVYANYIEPPAPTRK